MLKKFSIGTPVYDRNTNGKENLSDQLIERMEENVIKIESGIHNGKIGKCQMYNVKQEIVKYEYWSIASMSASPVAATLFS